MSFPEHLAGKVAFISGGASGIGLAVASTLASEGVQVVIGDISSEVEHVAEELARQTSGTVAGVQLDVGNAAHVGNVIEEIVAKYSGLHILGNIAGIYGRSPLLQMSPEQWDRTITTNLRGTFLCIRFALPHMVQQGYGRVVSIVSGLGVTGVAEGSAYAASKAAVVALTKSVAQEVAAHNVTVNCLAPGITDTPLLRSTYTQEEIDRVTVRSTRGVGVPEDVAGPFLFLLSPSASRMTGVTLWMRNP